MILCLIQTVNLFLITSLSFLDYGITIVNQLNEGHFPCTVNSAALGAGFFWIPNPGEQYTLFGSKLGKLSKVSF